jgi:hypothetical protein
VINLRDPGMWCPTSHSETWSRIEVRHERTARWSDIVTPEDVICIQIFFKNVVLKDLSFFVKFYQLASVVDVIRHNQYDVTAVLIHYQTDLVVSICIVVVL